MEKFVSQGILNKLSVSFSRENKLDVNDQSNIKYVQVNTFYLYSTEF